MGCTCPTDEPEDCGCDGSEYQGVDGTWRLLCLALGAVGLIGAVIFTGIPAGVAGWKKIPCINVICFSVCSGIWSLIFIGCGAAFLAISVMLSPAGPWGKEVMKVCPKEEVDLETDMLDETTAEAIDCAAESLCRGTHTILSNLVRTSNAIGAPFMIAGIVMFVGCYVCCCCKNSVPQGDDEGTTEMAKVAPLEPPQATIVQAVPAEPAAP